MLEVGGANFKQHGHGPAQAEAFGCFFSSHVAAQVNAQSKTMPSAKHSNRLGW